jgi:RNA polymerase sigma-70 factor (ECF subfamily)
MTDSATRRQELEPVIAELRPKLHRYCARMTGSVIDGEDVVQDAILKAIEASFTARRLANPEGWLFRIAHNAALDFLRRRARQQAMHSPEDAAMIATPVDPVSEREAAAASLRTFMRLPVAQRSAVILKDVLGYSLEEISALTGVSVAAMKSALQRGRARVRELAQEPAAAIGPVLTVAERDRLVKYVACFNARQFDTVRQMLAEDVKLELVNRLRLSGRDRVGEYFHRYGEAERWRFAAGAVEGRPTILVFDRHDPAGRPAYFILLEWGEESIAAIRDFLFARYALDGAELSLV